MFSKIHEIHVPLLLLVSLLMNLPSLMTLLLLALHDKVSLEEVSLNIITGIINPLGFKTLWTERKVEWQIEDLIKHSHIFFLLPSKKFLPISFKIQLLETSSQKQKKQRQKAIDVYFSDVFSLPVHFEFFASSLTIYILPSLSAC
jgi:hypothetical protein